MERYNFIHIGKCGGSTLTKELQDNGKNILHIHCRNINLIQKYNNYIITIRDPITRFVSAFIFKQYRSSFINNAKDVRPNERAGFKYWKTVNNLAENIYNKDGTLNKTAHSFIKMIVTT